jgi:UDP-glucose 4-epimerase
MRNIIEKNIVLVTGGCGFIGSHIVDRLVSDGYVVVVLDDLSTGSIDNLNKEAIFYQGDVSDQLFVNKVFDQHQISYVVHQATKINTNALHEDPLRDVRSSIDSTILLAGNCVKHKVKKLIYASSVAVYGRAEELPALESSLLEPIYSYGIAKYSAESYLKYYSIYYDLDYQILRYANVYGPRQPIYGEVGVIAIYTDRLIKGEQLIVFGDGKHQRDYIYVSDVVDFTVQSMKFRESSTYNIGRGIPVTVNELFTIFQKYDPEHKDALRKPERFGEIGSFYSDVSRALNTGWKIKVDLEQGISKTIDYFNSLYKSDGKINLRDANSEDEDTLFEWRNIDELVALSYYKKKVTITEHRQWFQNKLNSNLCTLLIVQLDGLNIGLIRMDSKRSECEVTIYLIPGYGGKGYGSKALSIALYKMDIKCKSYIAKVQTVNIPSQKLFEKLGFKETSRDTAFIVYQKQTTQ